LHKKGLFEKNKTLITFTNSLAISVAVLEAFFYEYKENNEDFILILLSILCLSLSME
jgi:hypothetical protein